MKTITIILCLCLICIPVCADSPVPKKGEEQIGLIGAGVIILCLSIAAGYAIHKIKSSLPDDHRPVKFVLEKSVDHSNWTPIVTNTITLNGTNAIEFFSEQMTDKIAFYRARHLQ